LQGYEIKRTSSIHETKNKNSFDYPTLLEQNGFRKYEYKLVTTNAKKTDDTARQ
jgi:hypothetical protein